MIPYNSQLDQLLLINFFFVFRPFRKWYIHFMIRFSKALINYSLLLVLVEKCILSTFHNLLQLMNYFKQKIQRNRQANC